MSLFSKIALLPSLKHVLAEKRFTNPTEIQEHALPLLLAGKSLVGVAETGERKDAGVRAADPASAQNDGE